MNRSRILFAALLALLAPLTLSADSDAALTERARRILRDTPVIDGHNDLPWAYRERVRNHLSQIDIASSTLTLEKPMQTDIPRLRRGGVGAQFWSVYVPADLSGPVAVATVLEQIDTVRRTTARYPETFESAVTADDIVRIEKSGRIASLIGVEGGHSIGNSLAVLRQLYALGARYMTLTHSSNDDWADSATDAPAHGGLTPFGKEVVREMNRLGMLVDLSHVAVTTMNQAIDISEAPVIFSHSSAYALAAHPRDVPDEVLRRLPAKDGVVMVTFVPSFVSERVRRYWADQKAAEAKINALLIGNPDAAKKELAEWEKQNPAPKATLSDVADHIDHIRKIAGVDHIGIGSDFDGIEEGPAGLDGVDKYPALMAELLKRGYSEDDIRKIAGLNLLRVMRKTEAVARRLQSERPASDVLIDEVDRPAAKPQ